MVIAAIPSFLNVSTVRHSDLQRTVNHLVPPVSIYALLITIYLLAVYKCFRLHFLFSFCFSWETVTQFGLLRPYLLSGSDSKYLANLAITVSCISTPRNLLRSSVEGSFHQSKTAEQSASVPLVVAQYMQ